MSTQALPPPDDETRASVASRFTECAKAFGAEIGPNGWAYCLDVPSDALAACLDPMIVPLAARHLEKCRGPNPDARQIAHRIFNQVQHTVRQTRPLMCFPFMPYELFDTSSPVRKVIVERIRQLMLGPETTSGRQETWTPPSPSELIVESEKPIPQASPVDPAGGERRFRRTGEVWSLQFDGTPVSVQHRVGLAYIAYLLRSPGRSFRCLELQLAVSGNPDGRQLLDKEDAATLTVAGSPGAEILDDTARKQYKDRRDYIEAELRRTEMNNDPARREQLEAEKQMLVEELKKATGLVGRPRKFATDAENARKAVARAIGTVLRKIGEQHPELAKHLEGRIDRGVSCCYRGDGVAWKV